MEIRVANFEELTKYYKEFIKGKREIHEVKKKFLAKIEPLKNEMESILKSATSGLIFDKNSEQMRMEKFRKLQEEAISYDNDFKFQFKKMTDELNVKVYEELEEIISEWSKNNNIDLVIGKLEVVFVKPEFEITEKIIDVLKEKGLYEESEEDLIEAVKKESV